MAAIFLIVAIPALADFNDIIERSFDVKPGGTLVLESDIGSIEIAGTDGNQVKIEVFLEAKVRDRDRAKEILDNFKVDFQQNGNTINILGDSKRSSSFWSKGENRLTVEFVIAVPDRFDIDLNTSAGNIRVKNLKGDVFAETSGGSLGFERIEGPVRAQTSGGSILLEDCVGAMEVETSGGSIRIDHVDGDVEAHTSGGSIKIEEVLGSINASTSGGSVTAEIVGQPDDDCYLSTSGGTIKVYLNDKVNLNVDAKTSAGYVESDLDVEVHGKVKKSTLRGKINDGGPELVLRTSGGNIYIDNRIIQKAVVFLFILDSVACIHVF